MATRLPLQNALTFPTTPVAGGSWGQTTGSTVLFLPTQKLGLLPAQAAGSTISWTAGTTALDRYYVTAPSRGRQTLSGTVSAFLLAKESAAGAHVRTRMEIYVVSRDLLTLRGIALTIGEYGVAADLSTAIRSKSWASVGTTLSTVSMEDGDRIVIGFGYGDSSGTTPSANGQWGSPTNLVDLVGNEAQTSGGPWVEFSASLSFHEINITDVDAVAWNSSLSSKATNSKTPTTGALQVIILAEFGSNSGTVPSAPTGCSMDNTWSTITTVTISNARVTVYAAVATAPTTGALTLAFNTTIGAGVVMWQEFSNTDTTSALSAIRQSATIGATTANPSWNLPSATLPDDATYSFLWDTLTFGSFTPRTGWSTRTTSGPGNGLVAEPQWNPTGDQTASATAASNNWVGVSFELKYGGQYIPAVCFGGAIAMQAVQRAGAR